MDITIIHKRLELLEKNETDIKNAKEMLKGELENSLEYQQVIEEEKEINNKKKRIKEEILNSTANKKLAEDIKGYSEEVSTLKEILSSELMALYEEKKSDLITDHHGETRKFKVSAKILPKNKGFQGRDQDGKYNQIIEDKEGVLYA